MRGSTHAALGIAVANLFQQSTIKSLFLNPIDILPIIAAYAGAIFCDIDLENSTISNSIFFMKYKSFRQLITLVFAGSFIAAVIKFQNTQYFPFVMAGFVICLIALTGLMKGIFTILKKIVLTGTAGLIILAGMIEKQPPLILVGIMILALMYSPHRGYSHSLIVIAACTAIVSYFCKYYKLIDVSLYFGLGMLTHVAGDMCTEEGVVLFFPYMKRIKLPVTFSIGSPLEYLIGLAAMCIFVIWSMN